MELMTMENIQTELGSIPSDWIHCRFEDVMDGFSSGQTPYREIKRYYTGDIPWITSGELNYNIITDTIEKITPEAVQKTGLKTIPKGTFLMAITGLEAEGTRGSCAITGVDATTNQSCMALYPKKDILITEYLFHFYVRYGNFLAFKYCQGTKQQSYTAAIAKTLPIILPPTIEEQTAIATALSDADALIKSLEKLIAKKRQIKEGVRHELFKTKKNWTNTKLGKVIEKVVGGGTPSRGKIEYWGGEIPWVTVKDFATFSPFSSQEYITLKGLKSSASNLIPKGTLIISTRIAVGKAVIFEVDVSINQDLKALFPMKDVNTKFLYYWFEHNQTMIFNLGSGSTVMGISLTELKNIEFDKPPIEDQLKIISVLEAIDLEIDCLERKLSKQRLLKQGMMQNMLTGKIRLV